MRFFLLNYRIPIDGERGAPPSPSTFFERKLPLKLKLKVGREPTKEQGDLFGIFFEDLNHAADGGLYGELVQNRSFEFDPIDSPKYHAPTAWETVQRGSSTANCHVESHTPLNTKNPHYLVLEVAKAGTGGGVRNLGYTTSISSSART